MRPTLDQGFSSADPWQLEEITLDPDRTAFAETILSLSNGTIGVRGSLEEGSPTAGTFVNGLYESFEIVYPESAYGLATAGQSIVTVPNAFRFDIEVDGERFATGMASAHRRVLNFRMGTLQRTVEWTTASGVAVSIDITRLVSLMRPTVMAARVQIATDQPATVRIVSQLVEPDPEQAAIDHDPRKGTRPHHRTLEPTECMVSEGIASWRWMTSNSGFPLSMAIAHRASHPLTPGAEMTILECNTDQPVELVKMIALEGSDRDLDGDLAVPLELGFAGLLEEQSEHLTSFWRSADIEVDGDPAAATAIRWTLFQIHQASFNLPGLSVPAKGLTGSAYDGHYFWDTEIYLLPFMAATHPDSAAQILRYRHSKLDAARRRAAELSVAGALFPWRTISGEEASAYFLAGTTQYHIDADIIYGLRQYHLMTGDDDLLFEIGVELAVETARMWLSLGFYSEDGFHIFGVTGPDEYTALVNDNAFTNRMAGLNLDYAADLVDLMRDRVPIRWEALAKRIKLDPSEPAQWRDAATNMFVHFDKRLGITAQDSTFLSKPAWDFAADQPRPLLLHYHPLVIYRYQMLKQSDVVLADFLVGENVSIEVKRANFDYYDPITTGDSSLSASIQSIMAAETGRIDRAVELFEEALLVDLADLAGNTADGVHMASAGGVWLALICGFGGLRIGPEGIRLRPTPPPTWDRLVFRLTYRGVLLIVETTHSKVTISTEGGNIELTVWDQMVVATPDPITLATRQP